MALLRHKGGSLTVTDNSGRLVTLHYGPGLHKSCEQCKVPKNVPCVTVNGKPLKTIHSCRKS